MLFMMILTVAMSLSLCLTHINGMVTTKAIATPLWDGEWSSTTSLVNWLLTSGPSAFFVIIGEHNKD